MDLEKQLEAQQKDWKRTKEIEEKIQLRQLKLEAFRLASAVKPSYTGNIVGQLTKAYTAKDLIKDAELIYESLIK